MKSDENNSSRREFLRMLGMVTTSTVLYSTSHTVVAALGSRSLSFYHIHTGESLKLEYYANGEYLDDALSAVNYLLRDFRTDEIYPIQPQLLNMIYGLQWLTDHYSTFEIISAYRSPKTNEALRRQGQGVAKHSLHMQGRAIDIRLQGLKTDKLREAAIELKAGGVGYYAKSDFIHVDTGRFRTW